MQILTLSDGFAEKARGQLRFSLALGHIETCEKQGLALLVDWPSGCNCTSWSQSLAWMLGGLVSGMKTGVIFWSILNEVTTSTDWPRSYLAQHSQLSFRLVSLVWFGIGGIALPSRAM